MALADRLRQICDGWRVRLGLVYGQRRQGKTFLLDHLVQASGGLIFTGLPQAGRINLRRLATAYARYTSGPVPAFEEWEVSATTAAILPARFHG